MKCTHKTMLFFSLLLFRSHFYICFQTRNRDFEFSETNRGKKCIVFDDYTFCLSKTLKSGILHERFLVLSCSTYLIKLFSYIYFGILKKVQAITYVKLRCHA